jgi:hypothetical protein
MGAMLPSTLTTGSGLGARARSTILTAAAECEKLGSAVLKYYTDPDVIEEERKWLAKIDELKAVIKSDKNGPLTLLSKWEGKNFDQLDTWKKLSGADQKDKEAMNRFVDEAITKVTENAQDYIRKHHVFHL